MKYLREISIREYCWNDSEDGESQAYVSENPQYLFVCRCDLVYKLAESKQDKFVPRSRLCYVPTIYAIFSLSPPPRLRAA